MRLIEKYHKCPRCGSMFTWNPDIGKNICSKCGQYVIPGMGELPGQKRTEGLFGKKKKV